MSTGEATMAIVLIVAIALPALAFWRLGTKFEVDNSPPLKAIALGIGLVLVGRIAAFVDLAFFDGSGQPLWLSAFILPAMAMGAIFSVVTIRLRTTSSPTPLRYSVIIIAVGLIGVIWHTTTDQAVPWVHPSTKVAAISVAHLAIDFVVLTAALTLGAYTSSQRGLPTRLITLGIVLFVISDMAYAVELTQNSFDFVSWTMVGSFVGPALITVATLLINADNVALDPSALSSDTWSLTYVPLGVLCVLQILDVRDDPHQLVGLSIFALMVLLLIGRIHSYKQAVTLMHRDLTNSLDVRERELVREQLMNDRIIGVAADGIVAVDLHDRVVLCNNAAREILAVPPDSATPATLHDLFHPDPSCDGDCEILDALHQSDRSMHDVTLDLDSEEKVIELAVRALDGPDAGFVLVFHDVTDRTRLARMKDRIVSVVSHEIRTPLTSIRGSLGLIEGGLAGPVDPRMKKMISIAVDSSERLMRLINDLLDVERIESGRRTLNLARTSIATLFEEILEVMAPIAAGKSIRIETTAAVGDVLADHDRIIQVLTNLVQNAIKFSEPGSTIHMSAEFDERHLTVSVRDEGGGIPTSHIEAIFEPFHQVDMTDSGPSSGSGLGLAISKGIIEAHGGTIWAERGVDNGALIRFRIPIRDETPFNGPSRAHEPTVARSS
ncbi:MAG: sensor histidine kinase [Ilumatobacteraceae bacterium]